MTAAVLGVILNLAIWFAIHVVWREVVQVASGPLQMDLPVLTSIDWLAATLSLLAIFVVFRFRLGMSTVLSGAAGVGLALHLAGMA